MLAKIGTFILDYIGKKLWSWLRTLFVQKEKVADQSEQAEKKADDFQKVVADPTKTREERRRAEDTFLNS